MGQRHQAFAIAQIIPYGKTKPQYRCIAAWHHQWCYGRLPLHATHRLTTLLKQKDNAEIVRHEIASINGKFGTFGKRPEIPDVPCPYIGFLLCQAFSTNLEITSDKDSTAYYSGVSFANNHLDAGMGSTEGDNNDGISVIDVTDPSNPAYCFVSIYGLEGGGDVPELAPLSAEQYARSYYPEDSSPPEVEADVVATIAKLDDVRLLTLQALAEAWPTEYGAVAEPESIDEAVMPDEDSASRVPTLASITLTSAVDHALTSGDTAELETLIWMPDKTAAIGSALREKSPFPDSGLSLLGQYLKYDSKGDVPNVDLVGFSLNPDQTATIVSQFEQVDTLKLPSISSIDTVRKTLTSLPRVRRLHLLDSNITSEELGLLLRNEPALFYHLEELVHPLMFDNDTEHHVNAFSCLQRERHSIMGGMGLAIASLPLLNPPQVIQALVDIFTAITANKMGAMGLSMTALVPQVAMGTAPRPAGEPWGQRHVSSFPKVCANALFGEGWLFVFTLTDGYSGRFVYYGFTKVNRKVLERNMKKAAQKQSKKDGEEAHEEEEEASDVNHVVCGLAGFLEIMKEEGRPLPSPQVTKQLETIFAKLEEQGTRVIVPSDVEEMVLSGRRGF